MENEKFIRKVDNSSYRERFQFQLLINDNIICQRYFKIPLFNRNSLNSEELNEALRASVNMIKSDLESKSRVYLANIFDCKTKLTGFASKAKALKEARETGATHAEIVNILLRKEEDETYALYNPKEWDETEFVKYGDVTFNFVFMVDDRVVYSEIWDGAQYPKYIRNSVDITNAKSSYPMVQLMNAGKPDLAVGIINMICTACSDVENEKQRNYIKTMKYGEKKYSYSTKDLDFINGWRIYCMKKYGNKTH